MVIIINRFSSFRLPPSIIYNILSVFFFPPLQLATCAAIKLEDYHFRHHADAFGRYLVLSNVLLTLRVCHLLPGAGHRR